MPVRMLLLHHSGPEYINNAVYNTLALIPDLFYYNHILTLNTIHYIDNEQSLYRMRHR